MSTTDRSRTPSATPLFTAGTLGYAAFRIPALLRVGDQVLAFCEGRVSSPSDTGEIRTVLRRSIDGGRTWGALEVVAADPGLTIGNPVPLMTAAGDVVLLTTSNGATRAESELKRPGVPPAERRRVWVQRAAGTAAPFSVAVEVTADVKPEDWGWYATGPSGGIRLTGGPCAGRLIAACAHSVLATDDVRRYGSHLILSDDDGATWRLGATDSPPRPAGDRVSPNEAAAAETGTMVYVNARNEAPGGGRVGAWSPDGGETFSARFRRHGDIASAAVQGHVVGGAARAPDGSVGGMADELVLSLPGDPERRRDVALRRSVDHGATWGPPEVVVRGPGAYSSLARRDDGGLDLLVETGGTSPYEQIAYLQLPSRGRPR